MNSTKMVDLRGKNMDEYITLDEIIDTAEDLGWSVKVFDDYVMFENWTDYAGQDLVIETDSTDPKEVIDFVIDFARSYDVDDEVELFVEFRGQRGVPERIRDIIKDCEEAESLYAELADELYKLTI